jgi:hypothetical protein
MVIIYETQEIFKLLLLLIKKSRKNQLSASVCMLNTELCKQFSRWLWLHGDIDCAHGVCDDDVTAKFIELQPVFIDVNLHQKNVAIIVGVEKYIENERFQKVFLINSVCGFVDAKRYVYANDQWKELFLS